MSGHAHTVIGEVGLFYDNMIETRQLVQLDRQHLWHPFTPMKQWRQTQPLIIESGDGPYLIGTDGRRYIDGVSSLWCNVHGHRVLQIDQAIRQQLDLIAHTTLLGLASRPSIELAARLCWITPDTLNKVFYSDAGATAVEIALKMAVGYWHHKGKPGKNRFVAFRGAYHGDTTGSISVGYNNLFHHPFSSMIFPVIWSPAPDALRGFKADACHGSNPDLWPSEDPRCCDGEECLDELQRILQKRHQEIAAVIIEPLMQGAAGMMCQPPGFLSKVKQLTQRFGTLLIADEVATGFGRTARMFACDHQAVDPDIMCLAKGLSGGYLPLAATLATDEIEQSFTGKLADHRTLYHGHTYTGNSLACAAAIACLDLFESTHLLEHIAQSSTMLASKLQVLRPCRHVLDIRQCGLMVGIELGNNRDQAQPFDFAKQTGAAICTAMRDKGLIVRPLGDVIVLMPIPAMPHDTLGQMLDIVTETILTWPFD